MSTTLVETKERRAGLVVSIDAEKVIDVELLCDGIQASGTGNATVRRFGDRVSFALATVEIAGYDSMNGCCVTGRVSIGLTWTDRADTGVPVKGTALAEGSWHGGPIRFDHRLRPEAAGTASLPLAKIAGGHP